MTLVDSRPGGSFAAHPASRHPALALLADLGVIREADSPRCHVTDLSRAHPVWSVHLPDGRRLVVKSSAPDRGFDLGLELLVYRLAVWCEPVRQALPDAVVVDEDRHVLVLRDVSSDTSSGSLAQQAGWPALVHPAASPGMPLSALAEATHRLGATLGALHRGTSGMPLPPARPPLILGGLTGKYPSGGPLSAALAAVGSDAVIVEAAERMASPVTGCLVNHDMKWDNVVMAQSGRAVLLDWELAGLGDPAWDVGCLLAESLVRQGDSPAGRSSGPPSLAADVAARALLTSYVQTARLRAEVVVTFARRVVTAAGLRVAQLGLEVGDTPGHAWRGVGAPGRPKALVDHARVILQAGDTLTEEVARCLR